MTVDKQGDKHGKGRWSVPYVGTYSSEAAARDDYDIVKDLHAADAVGTYDAAVITKDFVRQGARQQGRDGDAARRAGRRSRRCCGRHCSSLRRSSAPRSSSVPSVRPAASCGADVDAAVKEAAGEIG